MPVLRLGCLIRLYQYERRNYNPTSYLPNTRNPYTVFKDPIIR